MLHKLIPASEFTIEELTYAYNQTRVDYLVPMPMNAKRLEEYVHHYDVDMDRSVVAMVRDEMLALGMLGVRPGRAWITRLGVLPASRRGGVGESIMRYMLARADESGIPLNILEVIKNNAPAHQLFLKCNFHETRELLILRRPPGSPKVLPKGQCRWMEQEEALRYLAFHPVPQAWTNHIETYLNSGDVLGLYVEVNGSSGWMIFRCQKFILTHFVMHTEAGDPQVVGLELLRCLHQKFPMKDTYVENITVDDPQLPAMYAMGYIEAFRRIEMYRHVK
ncbi:MAG: GNAT family N-acetyltransferase [Anaerolineaceae bacterium]|jgi:ribosomal protein S18 acetylase RimI-like enzyme|nr:GNAT family N-acetyltransferase [Anaerolineaceae bacterium]